MFGKKNTDISVDKIELTVDTIPQSESTPEKTPAESVNMGPPPSPKSEPNTAELAATETELARLRDILFGGQARSTEKRMNDLELRVETIRQELSDQIERKVGNLDQTAVNDWIN